jgi:hypothetical protein
LEQLIVSILFSIAALVLCAARPDVGCIVLGIFYLIMAIGVNLVLVIVAPDQFVALGTSEPLLAPYHWFFSVVVAAAPRAFGVLAAAYEIAVGLLLLSKGRQVTWGVIGGMVHLIGITPLGTWTLANPVLALALALLLRKQYDQNFLELIQSLVGQRRTRRTDLHVTGHP